ncbi:MAG: sensor histidine kinase [Methyloligellaceae bacterium]
MIPSRLKPTDWPITVKVPLLVACLMVAVSTVLSERLLQRLTDLQEKDLHALAITHLNGLTSSLQPYVLREDVWEVFDALDRTQGKGTGFRPLRTVVTNADNRVLAASDPRWLPVKSLLPATLSEKFPDATDLVIDEGANRAFARRQIVYQGRDVGYVFAEIDIAPLVAERRNVLTTLLITNTLLTLALATIGYLAVRRMLRPVRVLTNHIDRGRRGQVEKIRNSQIQKEGSEFGRLFRRYNALVQAVNEREAFAAKLAEEEKLASLGRLASGMAHEINNPLGGMFNALDTLKQHGAAAAVRKTSIRLLEQGLGGIRDVVRSTLLTYRREHSERSLEPGDLDDLRLLILPEARRKALMIVWDNALPGDVSVPAGEVRQIVLNLLLNAIAATDPEGLIEFGATLADGRLTIEVVDTGPGLPPELVVFLHSDEGGRAPIEDSGGLGLWMVRRLVRALHGTIEVNTREESGTSISIRLPVAADQEAVRDVA